jgi:hypothetical protein
MFLILEITYFQFIPLKLYCFNCEISICNAVFISHLLNLQPDYSTIRSWNFYVFILKFPGGIRMNTKR